MSKILLSETAGNILTLTLNRPDKLNALTPVLLSELAAELDKAATDRDISVVIIKSAGHVFCAGYDLNEADWITSQYPANFENGVDYDTDKADIEALLAYWLKLWGFPKPIIAEVQGPCLSGGGELLAVCDIVIASKKASFSHPAARDLGIPPTVFLWPILIGMRKTKELLYTAGTLDAEQAEQLGLINHVVSSDALSQKTLEIARDIARTPIDHLMILKEATHNFYENMGMHDAMKKAAKLDADFHQSETFLTFFKTVRENGMKSALDARRKKFG